MNPGMPQVSVITVQPERTPIVAELPGRVDAVRDAQIRARVTGIVQKIAFEQGGDVQEKQLLFKIDPAPYKAAYDQATAQLKQAQANLFSAKVLADRTRRWSRPMRSASRNTTTPWRRTARPRPPWPPPRPRRTTPRSTSATPT